MPNKPARPCPGRGPRWGSCPNLVGGDERYCAECAVYEKAAARGYDKQRGNSGERGYDATWRKVQAMKLARDPLCEEHLKQGQDVAASMVHHIQPIETHPELRLVESNLMSLCNPCHEAKERRWGR